jgi:hypothetical protein
MTKPTGALHWADSPTTLRTEPAEGVKNAGFSVLTKLPAQYFNYIAGVCGDWITWLNLRLFDAYTLPTYGSDCRITGDPDEGMKVRNAAGDFLPVNGSKFYLGAAQDIEISEADGVAIVDSDVSAAAFQLNADYYSSIVVPLGSCLTNEFGGARWMRSSGSGATNDLLLSLAAGAHAVFYMQVPEGAKVTNVVVDWQPAAADSATKMRMSAQAVSTIWGDNGTNVVLIGASEMLSTTYVNAQASTDRKWGVMTCDQNNTTFTNSGGAAKYVRILVESSSEGANDKLYAVYLTCVHRSAGHLSAAPQIA